MQQSREPLRGGVHVRCGAVGQELLDTAFGISSFAEDNDGELYVIDYGGGVHQLVDVP